MGTFTATVVLYDHADNDHDCPAWARLIEQSGIIPQIGSYVDFADGPEASPLVHFITYRYEADGVRVNIFLQEQ